VAHPARLGIALALGVLLVAAGADAEGNERRRKSQLGLGIGLAGTASQVGDVFGPGTDASLLVNQHVYKGFGVRVLIGGIYLGSPEEEAERETYLTGLGFFGSSFRNFSMSYEYVTFGPSFFYEFGESHSVMAAVTWGLFNVKMDMAALNEQRLKVSNRRYGINAGVVYQYWIGDSWGLNARCELSRVDTKTDADDLYYAFARGDSDPVFVSILIGLQVGYR
jgi:hypothetical protein